MRQADVDAKAYAYAWPHTHSVSLSSALTLTVCGRSAVAVAVAVDAVVGASRLTLIALTHEMPFNLRAGLTRRSPQRSLTVVKRSFNASAFVSLSLSAPPSLLAIGNFSMRTA